MLFINRCVLLFTLITFIVAINGQQRCQDFSADPTNCAKFIRCFQNIRIRFTCPSGTAWEDSLKACFHIEYVEACKVGLQQRKLDTIDDEITFDADVDTLNNTPIGQTFAEARALGPIVTPKQYRCSFCSTGQCGIVVNTIQCFCGSVQCPPSTTATTTTPQPRNPCAENPCRNGGQCVPVGAGFMCNCPSTFTGNLCEAPAPSPCQPNPCQNGGICIPQGSSFTCQCPSNYNGYCCENRITTTTPFNPCAQSPCRNGGTCVPQGSSFMCICPSTYTGFCCETLVTTTTPFNPCAYSPCQNGGQCIPTGNSFVCQCPTGYYGTRCENCNYCIPNPCANNGLCTQTTTGYICSCSYPYTGTNCQEIISTTTTTTTTVATRAPCGNNCVCVVSPCPVVVVKNPCAPNPCQNMGGCSVQRNNIAKCWCPDGYQGYYCQFGRSARSLLSKSCNKTCLNGGQCYIDEKQGGIALCSCPNEYYGSRCELMNGPKSCLPKNPCMNNGKCITTSAGSQCVCQDGTSGVLCEKVSERSLNRKVCSLNCQAGGTCIIVGTTPKCRCPPGLNGKFCENRSG